MKKKHIPAVFNDPAVVNFFSNNPEDEIGVDLKIKKIKQRHNTLCDRYFSVLKESRLLRIHLNKIYDEYRTLLSDVGELASVHLGTPQALSIREVSEVIEETMFAIWRYMYDKRMCA